MNRMPRNSSKTCWIANGSRTMKRIVLGIRSIEMFISLEESRKATFLKETILIGTICNWL